MLLWKGRVLLETHTLASSNEHLKKNTHTNAPTQNRALEMHGQLVDWLKAESFATGGVDGCGHSSVFMNDTFLLQTQYQVPAQNCTESHLNCVHWSDITVSGRHSLHSVDRCQRIMCKKNCTDSLKLLLWLYICKVCESHTNTCTHSPLCIMLKPFINTQLVYNSVQRDGASISSLAVTLCTLQPH